VLEVSTRNDLEKIGGQGMEPCLLISTKAAEFLQSGTNQVERLLTLDTEQPPFTRLVQQIPLCVRAFLRMALAHLEVDRDQRAQDRDHRDDLGNVEDFFKGQDTFSARCTGLMMSQSSSAEILCRPGLTHGILWILGPGWSTQDENTLGRIRHSAKRMA